MLNKLPDTALVVEYLGLDIVIISQVGENYPYACVKESLLTKSL